NIPASLSATPGDSTRTQDNTIRKLGFESLTNYQWCHLVPANQDYKAWGEKAQAMYPQFDSDFSVPFFPHVSISWDPNPRFPEGVQPCVSGVTPEKFETFLRVAKDYADAHPAQPPLITINAWNEWAEGSYLEPDTEYGYRYLEAVKRVFTE
ncbi:MAG: glycoside hydrolase family 99-like domain-containing protein, partial [Bacteroidales bacterium]|nr:glycoside hydrolase family 99-like domain-containing protein [Bacteroidales bacterium]